MREAPPVAATAIPKRFATRHTGPSSCWPLPCLEVGVFASRQRVDPRCGSVCVLRRVAR